MIKKRIITMVGFLFCIGMCSICMYWYYTYQQKLSELNENEIFSENEVTSDSAIDQENNETIIKNNSDSEVNIDEAYQKALINGNQALKLAQNSTDNLWIIEYDSENWEEALKEEDLIAEKMQELFLDSTAVSASWYLLDPNFEMNETWEFFTGLNYSDEQIPVCWIDYDDDKNILAALIAQYDVESNIFWNTSHYVTYFGNQYAFSEYGEDEEEEYNNESISSQQFVSGVKSIADALEEYTQPLVVDPGDIPYKYTDDDEEDTAR